MSDLSYASIAPLIAQAQQGGRAMRFTFRCPVTGQTVQASYTFPNDPGVGSKVTAAAKRSLWYELRREIGYAIRAVFGYNIVGRLASDLANSAMSASRSGVSTAAQYSEEERQVAAVEAFRSVSSQFVWDAKNSRWVSRRAIQDTLSPFERQVTEAPIAQPYDRDILARMLVEVACADGTMAEEEESFLMEFLDSDAGSVDDLARRPVLTEAELGETSAGPVRETMLMLAWVLAISDEEFADAEKKKLDAFSAGLGLPPMRKADVAKKAQGYLLDQALEKMFGFGGHDETARNELMKLADRIGMDRRAAAVVEAQFQKRRGKTTGR